MHCGVQNTQCTWVLLGLHNPQWLKNCTLHMDPAWIAQCSVVLRIALWSLPSMMNMYRYASLHCTSIICTLILYCTVYCVQILESSNQYSIVIQQIVFLVINFTLFPCFYADILASLDQILHRDSCFSWLDFAQIFLLLLIRFCTEILASLD